MNPAEPQYWSRDTHEEDRERYRLQRLEWITDDLAEAVEDDRKALETISAKLDSLPGQIAVMMDERVNTILDQRELAAVRTQAQERRKWVFGVIKGIVLAVIAAGIGFCAR